MVSASGESYTRRMVGSTPGDTYDNPLVTRYSSRAMRELFSPMRRTLVWRDLWIALAEAQHELGLDVTREQIDELRSTRDTIDLGRVAELERDLRHDVMAHVHHYGELAPLARPILHLGATSCYVTDNADLILQRDALALIEEGLVATCRALADQALRHADLACLGYTHYQPAQPTTVGKRVCLWLQGFVSDLGTIDRLRATMPLRGVKGKTGTQASFFDLFDGDHDKVCELERRVVDKMGFASAFAVTGQTYPRKFDHEVLSALAGVAQSAAKFGVDIRLLSHEGELCEPFTDKQIGSSAMAYKRNPMRTERVCSLARYVQALLPTAGITASTQWLERTLDDSAIRRITIPEAFLATDACLILTANVARGMTVFPRVVQRNLDESLPFMATENLLMEGVRAGGDRQDLHERIRVHSIEAMRRIREEGEPNTLVELLEGDDAFAWARGRMSELLEPGKLIGRAPRQVRDFLEEVVEPALAGRTGATGDDVCV